MTRAWTIVTGLVAALLAGLAFQTPARAAAREIPPAGATVAVIQLHDDINTYTQSQLERRFAQALGQGAKVVIIDLDTRGGAVVAALNMTHFIKRQSGVHTIAYVNTKAYSAGAMIAVACNEIVVAPVAAIGDAAPIAINPGGTLQPLPETERDKAESPIRADFADSARRNGYDVLLVESMVTLKRVVHWVEKDGVRRFVDAEAFKQLTTEGWKPVAEVRDPVDAESSLLTVSGSEAIKLGLASGSAASVNDLIGQRQWQLIATYVPSAGDKVIDLLNHEAVRAILLTIFLTTLYIALHAPGHGFAEVIALTSLGLLLGMPLLTGYAQWWEILAVLVGIGLLALELFIIPGFGVAGITGIALIVIGLLLTFVAPEPGRSPLSIPRLPMTWNAIQQGLMVVVGGILASILLSLWLRRYLPSLPYFNRLILNTVVGSESGMVGSLTNIDPNELCPAVGSIGIAVTDLRPGGSAEFRDPAGGVHVISVVCDSGFVQRGTALEVRESAGNRVVVRPSMAHQPGTQAQGKA